MNIQKPVLINENFLILQDLAYIVECFASNAPGEGKSELYQLISKLEKSSISNKEYLLMTLKEASELFMNDKYRHAQITVVRASRHQWQEFKQLGDGE